MFTEENRFSRNNSGGQWGFLVIVDFENGFPVG